MSDLARSDYSPLLVEPGEALSAARPRIPPSKKPNLVTLAGLACTTELLTIGLSFWLSCIICKHLVSTFEVPPFRFGVIVCVLMIASIVERGDYGAGVLLERGLRPWSLGAALLQTVGVASFLASLSLADGWIWFTGSRVPAELTGVNAASLAVWTSAFLILCYPALLVTRLLVRELSTTLAYPRRVVLVGPPQTRADMVDNVRRMSSRSVRVLGVVDPEEWSELHAGDTGTTGEVPVLGNLDHLLDLAHAGEVDAVVINLPWSQGAKIRSIVEAVGGTSVDVFLAPELTGLHLPQMAPAALSNMTLIRALYPPLLGWQALLKRLEDIVIAGTLTLLLSPLMLAIAAVIKLTSPGPVFFTQTRVGYGGQTFKVLKFRTMYTHMSDAHATQQTRRNDPRITPIGALLRRKSIDELPQLLNVLRGDMSLVGPRPHAMGTTAGGVPLEKAAPAYPLRQRVRPGLTGWAQVNGKRGALRTSKDVVDRISYDLEYIRNWSLAFDLRILFMTLPLLSHDENAY